jgi:hypothetical protein
MVVALISALCCSVRAQQPTSAEPQLGYLRGPSFPVSKHGPAWPKVYRPDAAAVSGSAAEPSTGTLQPEIATAKARGAGTLGDASGTGTVERA